MLADPRPGVLPFVGLAQGADLQHVRHAVRLLDDLSLPEHRRADLRVALFLLSGYHFTSQELLAIMSEETLMQSNTYLWTLEKGREEGRRALLAELLRARLGPIAGLESRLASASPEAIASLAESLAAGAPSEALRTEVEGLRGLPPSEA